MELIKKNDKVCTAYGDGVVSRQPVELVTNVEWIFYVRMTSGEYAGEEIYVQHVTKMEEKDSKE